MYFTGIIDDVYDDGFIKFKLEEESYIDSIELPINLFKNAKLDSRYKVHITELPRFEIDKRREKDSKTY